MKEVLNENYWRDKGIIFLGEIDDESAERTVKEMIWMSKQGLSSISILMNGPGGVVSAGYYIHDVIQSLKNKGIIVKTVCCGVCASMDAFILASGSPGHRICLPNAEVMIHQPLGGMQGQASDMRIQWEHTAKKMFWLPITYHQNVHSHI